MRLSILSMLWLMLIPIIIMWHFIHRPTCQVNVHPPGIGFCTVLQAEFLADLLDAGFDLLDVAGGVVSFAYDDVEVGLVCLAGVTDSLFEDFFGLGWRYLVSIVDLGVDKCRKLEACHVFEKGSSFRSQSCIGKTNRSYESTHLRTRLEAP